MKTNVTDHIQTPSVGEWKTPSRPRWKVWNSRRKKILAQIRHVLIRNDERTSGLQSRHKQEVLSRSLIKGGGLEEGAEPQHWSSACQVLFGLHSPQHPPAVKVLPREHCFFRHKTNTFAHKTHIQKQERSSTTGLKGKNQSVFPVAQLLGLH